MTLCKHSEVKLVIKGHGCSTAVECTPRDQEVKGSYTPGLLLSHPSKKFEARSYSIKTRDLLESNAVSAGHNYFPLIQ